MRFLLCLAVFFWVGPSLAKSETFKIDKVHSRVWFSVSHLQFSQSVGGFSNIDGQFVFDGKNPSASSVIATIDVASLSMGDSGWDKKMWSRDFFDQSKFPSMQFVSERVEVLDKKKLRIIGNLTLLGVTRQVVLDTQINRVGRHQYSLKRTAGFSATATIKRSDFGMTNTLPAVGDEVQIRLEIEGNKIATP